ncbi:MAG: hypothetical protein J2P36_37500, partial [Ktedonobacteraceae bacterium]|nr:hypothetical protein [Ktedonobacteraceae bacterium]
MATQHQTYPDIRIRALGPLKIEKRLSSQSVSPPHFEMMDGDALGQRSRPLLTMLKLLMSSAGRHATKEYIADILWPDTDNALASLRKTKHELSKVLSAMDGTRLLYETSDGLGFYLAPQSAIEIDADQ